MPRANRTKGSETRGRDWSHSGKTKVPNQNDTTWKRDRITTLKMKDSVLPFKAATGPLSFRPTRPIHASLHHRAVNVPTSQETQSPRPPAAKETLAQRNASFPPPTPRSRPGRRTRRRTWLLIPRRRNPPGTHLDGGSTSTVIPTSSKTARRRSVSGAVLHRFRNRGLGSARRAARPRLTCARQLHTYKAGIIDSQHPLRPSGG